MRAREGCSDDRSGAGEECGSSDLDEFVTSGRGATAARAPRRDAFDGLRCSAWVEMENMSIWGGTGSGAVTFDGRLHKKQIHQFCAH